jgi:hypothetical protein
MKRHGIFFAGVLGGAGVFYLAAGLLALPAALRPPSNEQKMAKTEMAGEIIQHYLANYDKENKNRPNDWGKPLYLTDDILNTLYLATPSYPGIESEITREVFDWRPSPDSDSGAYSNFRLWLNRPAADGAPANPPHPEFWIALQCDKDVRVWVDGQDWMSPQALAAKLGEQIEAAGDDQARAAFLRDQIQYLNRLAAHS